MTAAHHAGEDPARTSWPRQDKRETRYVLPGSRAQEYARRRFPHKPVKEVTGGRAPPE